MNWNEVATFRFPLTAIISRNILRWPDGAEWMVGRTVTVHEIYKNEQCGNAGYALCDLDFGALNGGARLIAIPIAYLDVQHVPNKVEKALLDRRARAAEAAAAKVEPEQKFVDDALLDDVGDML